MDMFQVSDQAVEAVSIKLTESNYNLKELFAQIKTENPKVAEYIKSQASKSGRPLEIYGTGIVVYLLISSQYELDHAKSFDPEPADGLGNFKDFQDFLGSLDLSDLKDE